MNFTEFTLRYEGRLPSNGNPQIKHEIRKVFHNQLSELCKKIKTVSDCIQQNPAMFNHTLGNYNFVPILSSHLGFTVNLEIHLLRPEARGEKNIQSGDTDNRLKTLYDSLRMPLNLLELPKSVEPSQHETPFYCLLSDDSQIINFECKLKQGFIHESSAINTLVTIDVKVVNHSNYNYTF